MVSASGTSDEEGASWSDLEQQAAEDAIAIGIRSVVTGANIGYLPPGPILGIHPGANGINDRQFSQIWLKKSTDLRLNHNRLVESASVGIGNRV